MATATIVDLGKFLYFVRQETCPSLAEALTEENVGRYLNHLDKEQHIGPCGRSTKAQVVGQAARYMKSLVKDDSGEYLR